MEGQVRDPESPPGFVVRTEAQKAAWDNGYRLERGVEGRLAPLRLDDRSRHGVDCGRFAARALARLNRPFGRGRRDRRNTDFALVGPGPPPFS